MPNPRCLNGVKRALERDEYKNALQVYEDLNLVFLNALFYNEEESQISRDTGTLKVRMARVIRVLTLSYASTASA